MKSKIGNGRMHIIPTITAIVIGILVLLPQGVYAGTEDEQIIAGYSKDPGYPQDAKHPSIDTVNYGITAYQMAVFSMEVEPDGVWNIYACKNTGSGWGNLIRVCQSNNDQDYPDVKLIYLDSDTSTLKAFIVWQEGTGPDIISKAVTFSNMNGWAPYGNDGGTTGKKNIQTGSDHYYYPRIAGTYFYVDGFDIDVHIVWQATDDPVIQNRNFNYDGSNGAWDSIADIVGEEDYEISHPSIESQHLTISELGQDSYRSIVGITYDILDDGWYYVGFKRILFDRDGNRVSYTSGIGTTLIFDDQDSPFYPDITVSKSEWDESSQERDSKIYVVAQTLGDENNEIQSMANDWGGDSGYWYGPYDTGTMYDATPSLRGVAVDDKGGAPGTWIKTIWAVTDNTYSEIRTLQYTYDFPTYGGWQERVNPTPPYYPSGYPIDTIGIASGPLAYVAASAPGNDNYWYCLYQLSSRDVVYYKWIWS